MTAVAGLASRPGRLLLALVLACGAVLTSLLVGSQRAYAATDDVVRSLDVDYTVRADGVLDVKETWVWQFGDSSGRHGIDRYLVTREPYDDQQDAVYTVSGISVSTPTPSTVSTAVDQTTTSEQDGRLQDLRLRIGSADQTVDSPTATYVISYQVAGALRSFPDKQPPYSELYWDVTGTGNPEFQQIKVTAGVPDGPYQGGLTCFAGPPKTTSSCSQTPRVSGDDGVFGQDGLAAGDNLTIGVKIDPSAVAGATPDLVPRADAITPAERASQILVGVAGGGVAVAAPLLGALTYRRRGRDQRWAGLAPGTFPAQGAEPAVVPNDPKIVIPVMFAPPRIPVAEAGLLVDGVLDSKETAATLVDLAVRGALTIISESKRDLRVSLVDPGKATAPHELQLLNGIFGGRPPGTVIDLGAQGSMLTASGQMDDAVRQQVAARGWFTKVPSGTGRFSVRALAGLAVVVAFYFVHSSTRNFFTSGFHLGIGALIIGLAGLSVLITFFVVRAKLARGQRTPAGRAWTDQVEGFRTYIATAEADQLRFEEGEDIFSRYLPWAIVFGLADRWTKVCQRLVAMGRLPETAPGWYYGNLNMASFNAGFLTGAVTSAATPVPSSSGSDGTGFGGGSSSFDSGSSGGGGGGGGSGSW